MPKPQEIARTYDGSTLLMELLRKFGWGPLFNLGYFRLIEMSLLVFGLGPFQRRLARKGIELLDPQPGESLVEIGIGHG